MAETALITITNITETAPGRKTFEVADQNGTRFKVWNNQRAVVNVGQTYGIQYKINNFNGKNYNMIDSIKPAVAGALQPAPTTVSATGAGSYPGPAKGLPPAPDLKDEMIFVSVAIKESIRIGKLDPQSVTDYVTVATVARDAFNQIWRKKSPTTQSPQVDPEMSDSIPF